MTKYIFSVFQTVIKHTAIISAIVYILGSLFLGIEFAFDAAFLYRFLNNLTTLAQTIGLGTLLSIMMVGMMHNTDNQALAGYLNSTCIGFHKKFIRYIGMGLVVHTCNHGIIMVAMNMYKKGIPISGVIVILLSAPWTSIYIVVLMTMLAGIKFTLLISFLSILLSYCAFCIITAMLHYGILSINPNHLCTDYNITFSALMRQIFYANKSILGIRGFLHIFKKGFYQSLGVIKWIIVSIILTSVLMSLYDVHDQMVVSKMFTPDFYGIIDTLVFASLLEVCTDGISPFVAMFATQTHAYGNAFIILICGVATDYAEIMAIRSTTGMWSHALLLPMLTVPIAIFLASLVNQIMV